MEVEESIVKIAPSFWPLNSRCTLRPSIRANRRPPCCHVAGMDGIGCRGWQSSGHYGRRWMGDGRHSRVVVDEGRCERYFSQFTPKPSSFRNPQNFSEILCGKSDFQELIGNCRRCSQTRLKIIYIFGNDENISVT